MCADQTTDTSSRHFRNLGRALVILRELRHTSQRALARSTHGSTSHLSKYETGKALPKLETIERFLGKSQLSKCGGGKGSRSDQ